jgi:hypothetical protein
MQRNGRERLIAAFRAAGVEVSDEPLVATVNATSGQRAAIARGELVALHEVRRDDIRRREARLALDQHQGRSRQVRVPGIRRVPHGSRPASWHAYHAPYEQQPR